MDQVRSVSAATSAGSSGRSPVNSRRRLIRSTMAGCVANIEFERSSNFLIGFVKYRCCVARFATSRTSLSVPIFARARSRPAGFRVSSTDEASARYSRCRLTASWTSRAAIGARIARAMARTNMIAWRPPPAAAPEREAQEEIGQQGDRADHDPDEQREPDIEVPDVRQLVADDALELLAVELLEQSGRDRDRGVLRVTSGREGVRGGVVDEVDVRHGDVGRDRP